MVTLVARCAVAAFPRPRRSPRHSDYALLAGGMPADCRALKAYSPCGITRCTSYMVTHRCLTYTALWRASRVTTALSLKATTSATRRPMMYRKVVVRNARFVVAMSMRESYLECGYSCISYRPACETATVIALNDVAR